MANLPDRTATVHPEQPPLDPADIMLDLTDIGPIDPADRAWWAEVTRDLPTAADLADDDAWALANHPVIDDRDIEEEAAYRAAEWARFAAAEASLARQLADMDDMGPGPGYDDRADIYLD